MYLEANMTKEDFQFSVDATKYSVCCVQVKANCAKYYP